MKICDNFPILIWLLGKPSDLIFEKLKGGGGGGSVNPKFLSNFSRTNFTMVNGQKCDETLKILEESRY